MKFLPVNLTPEALKEKALELRVTLDLQQSVTATLAQIHDSDKQSFTRMFYLSYGLTLIPCHQ